MPTPSFDTWTIVFLIAAVQGFFIALVLFHWKRGRPLGKRLLAALVLLFSITLTEYVFYWTNYIQDFPHIAEISSCFPFLFGPLMYWYLRTCYEKTRLGYRDIWHLFPFALAFAAYLPWYILDAAGKQAVMLQQVRMPIWGISLGLITWGRIAHLLLYAIWCTRYVYRQPRWGRAPAGDGCSTVSFSVFVSHTPPILCCAVFPFSTPPGITIYRRP